MTEAPITFKTVTLCDKSWVDPLVLAENSPSADYNFGNIYIWDKRYRQLIARVGDRMLTKLRYEGKPAFVFPIGTGPLRPAIDLLRDFAAWRGYPLIIRGITDVHCEQLEREYPGCFTYSLEENNLDYIYRAAPWRRTTWTTSTGRRSWPPIPASPSTAKRTTATASRRSMTGSSFP